MRKMGPTLALAVIGIGFALFIAGYQGLFKLIGMTYQIVGDLSMFSIGVVIIGTVIVSVRHS